MKKINVCIYGGKSIFGGREVPRRAEIIYCDRSDQCSLYRKNQCLNVTAPFRNRCKYGKITQEQGYTSRSRKYNELKIKYENDPCNGALNYPYKCKIAKVAGEVYIMMPHANFKEDGTITNQAFLSQNVVWKQQSDLTVEFLEKICSLIPLSMTGETIVGYQKEEVPDFLLQLHNIMPSLHKELVYRYPQYDIPFNFVGKKAFVHSLRNGTRLIHKDGEFVINGSKLVCDEFRILFSPFEAKSWRIETEITDDLVTNITSNDQVDEETIFFD